ncbi:MAG TPA: hypothetical protein PKM73_04510 [Verrucomicrobiota bacterium]|nr:hypothetical protein [Verrucomicrobiota bacterium]HNU50599.1 hypothetical protein [Verrucomicrobiota bacterium]
MKGTLLSSAGLTLGGGAGGSFGVQAATAPADPAAAAASAMPRGRIGKLEVSRLLLGGNLLTHYTHSRDLRYVYTLAARYNTDEKIFETLAAAEAHGINTLSIHNPPHPISVLRRYREERGGKIQWIICPTAPVEPDLSKYTREVEDLVAMGANAIYLWGVHADALVNASQIELLAKAVEVPHRLGVPSGVGGHCLDVVKACEENHVNADFYIKTFHHHNYPTGPKPDELKAPYSEYPGYWCREPEETAAVMAKVQKPWIAFKTMAAGAIPPADAFRYAFTHGADFVLAGMFDFEIAEDTRIARETLGDLAGRSRPWRA